MFIKAIFGAIIALWLVLGTIGLILSVLLSPVILLLLPVWIIGAAAYVVILITLVIFWLVTA